MMSAAMMKPSPMVSVVLMMSVASEASLVSVVGLVVSTPVTIAIAIVVVSSKTASHLTNYN
jgi:hypothetical protein